MVITAQHELVHRTLGRWKYPGEAAVWAKWREAYFEELELRRFMRAKKKPGAVAVIVFHLDTLVFTSLTALPTIAAAPIAVVAQPNEDSGAHLCKRNVCTTSKQDCTLHSPLHAHAEEYAMQVARGSASSENATLQTLPEVGATTPQTPAPVLAKVHAIPGVVSTLQRLSRDYFELGMIMPEGHMADEAVKELLPWFRSLQLRVLVAVGVPVAVAMLGGLGQVPELILCHSLKVGVAVGDFQRGEHCKHPHDGAYKNPGTQCMNSSPLHDPCIMSIFGLYMLARALLWCLLLLLLAF